MLVEIGFESEGFATTLARERLQIGMSLDVGAQIGFVGESFLANLAGERLLAYYRQSKTKFSPLKIQKNSFFKYSTCMSSYVALQQPRSRERFTAIRTFASLTVGTNVHRESRNRHVNFVAMRATSRLKKSQISLAISFQFQIIF